MNATTAVALIGALIILAGGTWAAATNGVPAIYDPIVIIALGCCLMIAAVVLAVLP